MHGLFVGKLVAFLLTRWNDLGNITHNKSTILVELINKEETVLFHTVSHVDKGRVRLAACSWTSQLILSFPCSSYLERKFYRTETSNTCPVLS